MMRRLCVIAGGRLSMPQLAPPAELQAARAVYGSALRDQLQSWLECVEGQQALDHRRGGALTKQRPAAELGAAVAALQRHFTMPGGEERAAWPAGARSLALAELPRKKTRQQLSGAPNGRRCEDHSMNTAIDHLLWTARCLEHNCLWFAESPKRLEVVQLIKGHEHPWSCAMHQRYVFSSKNQNAKDRISA